MSFDSTITNIKSVSDLKNKEKEFFTNLRLRQKLNQKYDEALTKRAYIDKYDVPLPLPPMDKSLVEERSDVNYQYSVALRKLNSYLRPEIATEVIGQLTEPQIVQLNLHFEAIKKLIPIDGKNITADYFVSVFKRYEEFLVDTGNTGVILPERKTRELMPPPPPRMTMSGTPLIDPSSGFMTPGRPSEEYSTPAMSLTPLRPRPRPPVPSFSQTPKSQAPQSFLSELQSRLEGRRIESDIPTPPRVSTPTRRQPAPVVPKPAGINLGELQARISARKETSELPTEADISRKEEAALEKRKRSMILDLVPQLKASKGEWENQLQSGGRDPKIIVQEIVKGLMNGDLVSSLTTAERKKLLIPFGITGVYKDDIKEKFESAFQDILSGGSGMKKKMMKGLGIIGGLKCRSTCKEPSTDEIIGIIKAGNNNIMLKKELMKRSK